MPTTKIQKVFDGRFLKVQIEDIVLPNHKKIQLEVIRHVAAAAIVPYFERDHSILLIHQYRPAIDRWIWEIPAGLIEEGEDPEAAALRELEEEAGWTSEKAEKLIDFYPSCGYSDEIIHIFKATDLKPGTQRLEDGEVLEEKIFSVAQVQEMIQKREIIDPKTLIGLFYALPSLQFVSNALVK